MTPANALRQANPDTRAMINWYVPGALSGENSLTDKLISHSTIIEVN